MAKVYVKLEIDVPDGYTLPENPHDLLNEMEEKYSNVSLWNAEYCIEEKDHYYVYKDGIRVSDYDDPDSALRHAVKIGGNVSHEKH